MLQAPLLKLLDCETWTFKLTDTTNERELRLFNWHKKPYFGRFKGFQSMGRIIASVKVNNVADPSKSIRCDALVDTEASFMVLPMAWRDRLGDLETMTEVEMETATQETVKDIVCGPVRIRIEGFRPIHHEVAFVEMTPEDGEYEPLIGYLVLEHSQAGVDMPGHRLVKVKHVDLNGLSHRAEGATIKAHGKE